MLTDLLTDDTADFAHPVTTKGSTGGLNVTYPTAFAEGEPVRIEDLSAQEQLVYKQSQMIVTHRIFSQTEGVGNGDRVTTSDGRYIIIRKAQKRRGIGDIETFYVDIGEELRAGA